MKFQISLLLSAILLLTSCGPSNQGVYESDAGNTVVIGSFVGSELDGNFIYGAAMNLTWKDLSTNILEASIEFITENPDVLFLTEALNEAPFSTADLSEEDYYIRSGYGQETVDLINEEVFEKFPDRSLPPLDLQIGGEDIIAYAYFLKEVQYPQSFEVQPVKFQDQEVSGFAAVDHLDREQVLIVSYESEERFILSLILQDPQDQLFLAKGYSREELEALVADISASDSEEWTPLLEEDIFEMPILHLDHSHSYDAFIHQTLNVKGFERYEIGVMYENILFDLDENGARVENEAVIMLSTPSMDEPEELRYLILDDTFWVIMKETESENPYFVLEVANTSLMETEVTGE